MSDLRSRVLGTIFGTLSRGTFPQRNPVAFLYGPDKVRLPGLPEWDKEMYPYAWIEPYSEKIGGPTVGYLLYVASANLYTVGGSKYFRFTGKYAYYKTMIDGTEWILQSYGIDDDNTNVLVPSSKTFWVSHDVLNDGVDVYLAGSVPVPVYE